MPEYDYYCRHCQAPFSNWMTVREHDQSTAACPQCGKNEEVEKRVGDVQVVTNKKS